MLLVQSGKGVTRSDPLLSEAELWPATRSQRDRVNRAAFVVSRNGHGDKMVYETSLSNCGQTGRHKHDNFLLARAVAGTRHEENKKGNEPMNPSEFKFGVLFHKGPHDAGRSLAVDTWRDTRREAEKRVTEQERELTADQRAQGCRYSVLVVPRGYSPTWKPVIKLQ
jgi:hypothetical protein